MRPVLLLLAAAACTHAPPPFQVDDPHLRVHIRVPKSGALNVRLVVPAKHAWPGEPLEAQFSIVPERWLRQAVHPWPRLDNLPGSDLLVEFAIAVPRVVDNPGYPVLVGSFESDRARQLTFASLIPQLALKRRPGKVIDPLPAVIEIEADDDVVCSLPGGGGTYYANDMDSLFGAMCIVGDVTVVEASRGLRIASADFNRATLQRLADLEKRAADSLEASHGARRTLDLMLVHAQPAVHPAVFLAGINRGRTITLFSPVVPDGRATGAGTNVLLHELIHSYQPPDEALPHWITEGFTEYFEHRLGLQLDGLPEGALYEGLEALWVAFKVQAPQRRAAENLIGDYFGGAVLAYCIDVRLRRDGSSLERVLAATRAKSKGDVSNAQWEQQIALASAPAGALVLNARSMPIDAVEGCFKEAGLNLAASRRALRPSYLARVFKISSLDAEPRHYDVVVMKVHEGSVLKPRDAILSVNGVRVTSTEVMLEQLWLAQRESPHQAKLEVSRGGRVELLVVDLPEATQDEQIVSPRRIWQK